MARAVRTRVVLAAAPDGLAESLGDRPTPFHSATPPPA
jgi:hypothetical protein